MFSEDDLQGVEIVLCMRDTGMPLKDIKHYIDLCTHGKETFPERLKIIESQKKQSYEKLNTIKNDSIDDYNPVQW